MENYADALDLNCWTSSKAVKAIQDANNMWHVTVEKGDGTTRIFVVKHTVFAMGYWGGDPNMPQYPQLLEILFKCSLNFLLIFLNLLQFI